MSSRILGVALGVVIAAVLLFGSSTLATWAGLAAADLAPTPAATVPQIPPVRHEGLVEKIVVNDPHTGGWSGRASNPKSVVITLRSVDYSIENWDLRQAASAKPGDHVVITCYVYQATNVDPGSPSCKFSGFVYQTTSSPSPAKTQKR